LGGQIETQMGGARDTYGGEDKYIQEFGRKTLRKELTWNT